MKKIIILMIISISYYFCTICYASETATVFLTSNQDTIKKGEEIEITLHIEKSKTAAYTSYLYFNNEKFEFIEGPENTNVIENRIIHVWYDKMGGEGAKEGELAKFILKAKEDGVATFTLQGEFYNQEGKLIQTEIQEKQIQIGGEETAKTQKQAEDEQRTNRQSDNTNLQVLRINREGITPTFRKEIKEYNLTIPNDVQELEVQAISENPNSSVEITGNTKLKEGANVITVRVDSEDKTKSSIYTIQVTKTDDVELANANLEILAIENVFLDPVFHRDKVSYHAEVSKEMEKINLLAVPENENATIQIMGNETLQEGDNSIIIVVTAPNGLTQKKYEVNVYQRNFEEEQQYQEEQKSKNEMLEEAYQISEVGAKVEERKKGFPIIEVGVFLMVVLVTCVYMGVKKGNKKL